MAAATYTVQGRVTAIQYTGSNAADIQAALGTVYAVYASTVDTHLAVISDNVGGFFVDALLSPQDWLVSAPSYGTADPSFTNGFQVVQDGGFATQFTSST